jgi:uncharacterized membrane protein
MKFSKTEITLYILTFLVLIIGIFLLPNLPDKMATHWNQFGVADGFSSKIIGVLIMPISFLVLAFIYSLVSRTRYIKEDKDLKKPLDKLIIAAAVFLVLISVLSFLWNIGYNFNMSYFIIPPTGLLFFLMGYLIIDVKQNYFFGIRNLWSLKNKKVWKNTHYISGILFMILSIVMLFSIFFINYAFYTLLSGVLLLVLFSFIYSYIVFINEKKYKQISLKTVLKTKSFFFYFFIISIIIFLILLIIK